MKKVLLFAVVIGGVAFTSCSKKDLTCVCTTVSTGNTHVETTEFKGVKKDKAALQCASLTKTDTFVGNTPSTTTCELN